MHTRIRQTLIFGIAALTLILGMSSLALSRGRADGAPSEQKSGFALEEAPANGRYVPAIVGNAQGSYAAFPTATPAPTPVGVQDADNRFFVSAAVGDDANDGTRDAPFRSTERAFEAALGIENAEIYVSSWPQTVPISPTSGVSVYGGYSEGTWQRSPEAYTRVSSPGRPSLVIVAVSNVRIEGFQFEGGHYTDLAVLERMSVAAIVVDGGGIVLTDNIFIAANGANGEDGANGEGGATGSNGKNGTGGPVCPPSNPGGAGGAGARKGGAGGTGGAFGGYDGSAGQSVSGGAKGGAGGDGGGLAGASGKFGGKGQDGSSALTPGESGGPIGVFQDNLYLDESGKHGTSTRTAGAGGGGGGGGAGAVLFLCGGGGGGGGGGGYPAVSDGKGGQAGGPSFGLYVVDSEVSIRDNQITTGDGGDGGRGGAGAFGGAGGAGGYGADNGGRGGSGGDGGGSAPGGGGGGGPSIGIIANGGSNVSQTGNAFSLGAGGKGGAGGHPSNSLFPSSQAADGLRVEFYQAP